jgi:hypothetical protein
MAGFLSRIFEKVKSWIHWSWTYLWAAWFILVVFVVYILRGPLKLTENLSYGKHNMESCVSPPFLSIQIITRIMFIDIIT